MPGILVRAAAGAVVPRRRRCCSPCPTRRRKAPAASTLSGAGATFPAPLYYKWLELYGKDHPELAISYDAVGSGDGVARFVAGSVDFAASDAAISAKDAGQVARGALIVPATAGLVVLAYNLPGLGGALKLPRDVYADILRGRDQELGRPEDQGANPTLSLPKRTIAVVARLDSSGTTYALTNHLSAVERKMESGPWASAR